MIVHTIRASEQKECALSRYKVFQGTFAMFFFFNKHVPKTSIATLAASIYFFLLRPHYAAVQITVPGFTGTTSKLGVYYSIYWV